jgi:hypothetical protein
VTERRCEWCGAPLDPWRRKDARYHSPACRKAATRARLGVKHGWGGTQERRERRKRAAAREAVTGQ